MWVLKLRLYRHVAYYSRGDPPHHTFSARYITLWNRPKELPEKSELMNPAMSSLGWEGCLCGFVMSF